MSTDGQMDARLITISPEPCQSGDKDLTSGAGPFLAQGPLFEKKLAIKVPLQESNMFFYALTSAGP